MNRQLKYGLIASLLLWPFLAVAIAVCLDRLPAIDSWPLDEEHAFSRNWIGQGMIAGLVYALLLLAGIYSGKYLIGRLSVRWVRVYCFVLLVIASLPYIWLLVVLDWRNFHAFRVTCWVYYPI